VSNILVLTICLKLFNFSLFLFFKCLLFPPYNSIIYLDSFGLDSTSLATAIASFDLSVRTHDQFSVYASSVRSDLGCFSWNFHFFTNIFPSPIYAPIITEVLQTYKTF